MDHRRTFCVSRYLVQVRLGEVVHCNPENGYPSYVSGPEGYKSEIERMVKEYGFQYSVNQYHVTSMSPIGV